MHDKYSQFCLDMKLKALELTASTGASGAHIGGALSLVELMAVLLDKLHLNAEASRDRLILSKGHGAIALYTGLWKKGILTEDQLLSFDKDGSEFFGHPHRDVSKFIEFSGGSLGLGLSYAVGVAIACKKRGLDNRIFAIIGDGECDEGIVWEALMAASNFNLDNLTVIVDLNGFQLDGPTHDIMNSDSLTQKFRSFNFDVLEINGHDTAAIESALSHTSQHPVAIIAKTVKAHGISFLENTRQAHHSSLSSKKYQQAIDEIKSQYGME